MAEANILRELNRNQTLENLVLFGKIRCAIKRPSILGDNLQVSNNGVFAILDVFFVKCMKTDYFGGDGYDGLYPTKGSLVIFIGDTSLVRNVVKVGGTTLKNGVKVRQQYYHKSEYDGLTALAFAYNSGKYIVVPNYVKILADGDQDISRTPFMDHVLRLKANEAFEYPASLESIEAFSGVDDYEIINTDEVKIETSFKETKEKIDVSKIDLHLTYHLEGKQKSELSEDVQADIEEMQRNRLEYAKTLNKEIDDCFADLDNDEYKITVDKIKKAFQRNIAGRYNQNIYQSNVKGYVYVNDFITKAITTKPFNAPDDFKMPNAAELSRSIDVLKNLVEMDSSMLYEVADGVHAGMLKKDEGIIICILSVVLGIPMDVLESNYRSCNYSISMPVSLWVWVLLYLPYHAGVIGSSMSVLDCDKIYFGISRIYNEGGFPEKCLEMRNNLLYLKTLEDYDDKDTFVSTKDLSTAEYSYPGMGKRLFKQNNFPLKVDLINVLDAMAGKDVRLTDSEVYSLDKVSWYSKERTDSLIEYGLINSLESEKGLFVALEKDIEKEYIIYETLVRKGTQETGIKDETIQEAIEEFEAEKGFKLEKLQSDGINLCKYKAAVLSGCAGSGKTTVSDCITACLRKGLPNYKIIYGAPTGKACRRLAEVVGGSVRTLNSQFGVGLTGEGYLQDIRKRKAKDSKSIYILDEMAMCNRDLLFAVCRCLGEEDIVYFLGDCKQLPPIGKGNPFHILMQLLPCIELGVSKRAAEGSNVNYNTTLVNCLSDGVEEELLYDESSFLCEEVPNADIPITSMKVWKGLMDGTYNGKKYGEDDIQIISGYATPEKSFSSSSLNPIIQRYLRQHDKLLFTHANKNFYKKDRVIHTRLNSYGTQRYLEVENNVFKSVVTLGIMNGEVGKILGVVRTDLVQIMDFDPKDIEEETEIYGSLDEADIERLLEDREKKAEKIRNDSNFKNSNYYFVKVRVYDSDLGRDVIVLYPARGSQQDDILYLGGEDLDNLDLAYALTTHKMQGSQSMAIILPFGTDCSPTFINRNMINTMITRSQEVVVMIGDIKGRDSAVNKGRRFASEVKCNDLLTFLCEN